MELIGGWSEAALAPGTGYRQFSLGAEIVTIYGTGGVSIAAAPSAPGTGLDAIASGPAAPAIDSQPGIAAASPLSILSWYQLHGTETIEAYETWRSENGAPVVTSFVTSYSLINYGQSRVTERVALPKPFARATWTGSRIAARSAPR